MTQSDQVRAVIAIVLIIGLGMALYWFLPRVSMKPIKPKGPHDYKYLICGSPAEKWACIGADEIDFLNACEGSQDQVMDGYLIHDCNPNENHLTVYEKLSYENQPTPSRGEI